MHSRNYISKICSHELISVIQQEEQSDGDLPLPPIGLNFQLALFQNQMAQIQMMQAANASAMLNMGTNVGLNTLNAGNSGSVLIIACTMHNYSRVFYLYLTEKCYIILIYMHEARFKYLENT